MKSFKPIPPLRARTIVRILAPMLNSLAAWCDPNEIELAVKVLSHNLPKAKIQWLLIQASHTKPRDNGTESKN